MDPFWGRKRKTTGTMGVTTRRGRGGGSGGGGCGEGIRSGADREKVSVTCGGVSTDCSVSEVG